MEHQFELIVSNVWAEYYAFNLRTLQQLIVSYNHVSLSIGLHFCVCRTPNAGSACGFRHLIASSSFRVIHCLILINCILCTTSICDIDQEDVHNWMKWKWNSLDDWFDLWRNGINFYFSSKNEMLNIRNNASFSQRSDIEC